MIKDTRLDNSVCGITVSAVQYIPTADFLAQMDDQFNAWFEAIKGQLGEDAAGNLQLKIDDLQKQIDIMTHKYAVPALTGNCYTGYAVMEP